MLPPAERNTRPFGTRLPAGDAAASATPNRGTTESDKPAGALAWALRISALVGLLALFATHQLARLSQAGPAQLASAGRALPVDPETTGSIASADAARMTRLDPCLLPALDAHRR